MQILNIIGSVCSILGLLIGIILTTKIYKISNKIKDSNNNQVEQRDNFLGAGDIAGRDIHK